VPVVTRSIDDVIDRMQLVADSTHPDDGVGVFNFVYLRTTVAIRDRLDTGYFDSDLFVERFDILFANLYFAAIDAAAAGQRPAAAWRPLFTRRADRRVHAVQFAVAGMNAHINHDLALAVVQACAAEHTHPLADSIPADYFRITDVIEKIESAVRRSLLDDLERQLGEPLEPLVHLISSWSISQARQAAWIKANVLWQLRSTPLYADLVATSSTTTAMTSRHLLTPLLTRL
jgi:hypothetical protein